MNLDKYSTAKNDIISLISQTEDIITNDHHKKLLKTNCQKLSENYFNLVVIGQFKRGKTTFINALLGQDLLPTAVIPLTSIITVLRYGETLSIKIFFENNTAKEIKLDELADYITEKHNPKNEKKVNYAEILYPSQYLQNGVQIIDTPGIASIHEHNTEATYQYLPNADAAVFLVSVDPPITQAEFSLLNDLKNDISKIFFVLNKVDIVNDHDLNESLRYTKKIIEKEVGLENITIFPLSAREALNGKLLEDQEKLDKSGLLPFENALDEFLMNEKGNVLLDMAISKAQNVISQEILFTQIKQKSLHTPLEELEEKRKALQNMFSKINQERSDSAYLLNGEVQTLINEVLEADLENLKREKTAWLINDMKNAYKVNQTKGNRKFAQALDEYLSLQIKDIFNQWRSQEEKVIKTHLEKILQRFTNQVNIIIDHILSFSSELFNVPVDALIERESLTLETGFQFRLYDIVDDISITIDFLTNLLPKSLAHRLIFRQACKRAVMFVDQHCGRLRYDYINRIEKTVRDYKYILDQSVDIIMNNINSLLQTTQDIRQKTTEDISIFERELNEKMLQLTKLKSEFENIRQELFV